jgi:hypothetical protein
MESHMKLEKVSIWTAMIGVVILLASAAAYFSSLATGQEIGHLTAVLNSLGLAMISFGAGGILYATTFGN